MNKKVQVVMIATKEGSFNNIPIIKYKDGKLKYLNLPFTNNSWIGQHLYFLSDDKITEGDWFYDITTGKILKCSRVSDHRIYFYKNGRDNDGYEYVTGYETSKKIIATTDESLMWLDTSWKNPELGRPNGVYRPIAKPSESFIQHYITEYKKGNQIQEVLVEYIKEYEVEHFYSKETQWFREPSIFIAGHKSWFQKQGKVREVPKTNTDNTINIKPQKDSWSREEVETLCRDAFQAGCTIQNLICKSIETGEDLLLNRDDVLGENNWIKENL